MVFCLNKARMGIEDYFVVVLNEKDIPSMELQRIRNSEGEVFMKKLLVSLFALIALAITTQATFAACPCEKPCPCACSQQPCCEDWLCPQAVDDYFCKLGLNDCQKAEALMAIEQFKCDTQCQRANGCNCESKCECRQYRKALRDLDCKMKQIITACQKSDYKCVKHEIKDKVKCCHKCLINPFKRCKCACACK